MDAGILAFRPEQHRTQHGPRWRTTIIAGGMVVEAEPGVIPVEAVAAIRAAEEGSSPRAGDPSEDRRPAPADDIAFFNQMLDQLRSKFSVDASRIYAAGLSEGGFMTLRVGCALGERFAGIAAVGAAMPKTMICLPARPVPLVMINGTSDPMVKYGGGTEENLRLTTISVEDSAKAWAKIDRCAEKPEHSKLPSGKGGTETKVDTYTGCQQGAQVVPYSLKGAGNTWPGGSNTKSRRTVGKTSEDFKRERDPVEFSGHEETAGKSCGAAVRTRRLKPESSSLRFMRR